MTRRSEIRGNPNITKPGEVKRILKLARATSRDVFYDLGCGHGRVCILAAKKVRRAVGIEDHIATYKVAVKAVKKAGLQNKVRIRNSDFSFAKLADATIVYSTLNEDEADTDRFERLLKKGCRFISAGVPLIGIKPEQIDGTLYLMRVPFKHAKDEDDWARSVLNTRNTSASKLFRKYQKWYGRKITKDIIRTLRRRLKKWQFVKQD